MAMLISLFLREDFFEYSPSAGVVELLPWISFFVKMK